MVAAAGLLTLSFVCAYHYAITGDTETPDDDEVQWELDHTDVPILRALQYGRDSDNDVSESAEMLIKAIATHRRVQVIVSR